MTATILRTTLSFVLAVSLLPVAHAATPDSPPAARKDTIIQADTKARLTLRSRLSSKLSEVDDPVSATLADPLYVGGELVLNRGTEFLGRITKINRARADHHGTV